MRRHFWLLAIVITASVLPSCGGGGDKDVLGLGDRELDRCSLITASEAEQWIGGSVADPTPIEGFDGKPDPVTCEYGSGETGTNVLIQVYDGDIYFAEPGSASRTGETLDGLGEDAFIGDGSVKFLQNHWAVSVSWISGGGRQLPDQDLIDMAKLMSSRLP